MRIAIVPSAVLSGEVENQLLSLAVPLVLQQDLATSSQCFAAYAPDSSAAYSARANSILRTVVEVDHQHLRIQATLTSLRSQKVEKVLEVNGLRTSDLIPLTDQLAKAIDPDRASSFSTRNSGALQSFASAVATLNRVERNAILTKVTQDDPAFGLAQIALVENAPPGSAPSLPSPPVEQFVPLDRARWHALSARLQHAPIAVQAQADSLVIQLAPNNVEALARLGFQQFLQDKADEGQRLLERAIVLNPASLNLRLQLAEGLVVAREFAKAENLLSVLAKENPNVLPSLAAVYLLDAKKQQANETFRRYASFLPLASQAAAEARWAALDSATQPSVDLSNSAPPGIALFSEGRYAEAASVWSTAVNESGGANLAAKAMLAASLQRAGKAEEASKIKVQPFIPDFNDPFAPIAFGQMRALLKMK